MPVSQIVTYRELLESPDLDEANVMLERLTRCVAPLPGWVQEKGVRTVGISVWPLWQSGGVIEDCRNLHLELSMEDGQERRNRTDILTLYRTAMVHREVMGRDDEWEALVSAICALVLAG